MGRRSTKTTKTGKFMNPTDQWRKQCRKKELRKNKVQRTAVREAVIKSKNPQQLLAEIEEIEKMEIEAGSDELPNDKGLKEKKRKLHETLQRIINYYERDNDYNKAQQIKTLIVESEKRRRDMTAVYSSYRTARSQYNVSDIPLPEGPSLDEEDDQDIILADIPLPDDNNEPATVTKGLMPPGPPPGPPPSVVYPKAVTMRPNRSVHFTTSDDDDDDDDDTSSDDSDISDNSDSGGDDEDKNTTIDSNQDLSMRQSGSVPPRPPGPPPGLPPPGVHYAPPPPLFTGAPQPPIRGYHPPTAALPPPVMPRPLMTSSKPSPHFQSSAVISATPQPGGVAKQPTATVISAQPQIRNVQAEVTKFLPTSLRVRRDVPRQVKATPGVRTVDKNLIKPSLSSQRATPTAASGNLMKGDAYDAFMKEMQGLI